MDEVPALEDVDKACNEAITSMLQARQTWAQIIAATGCSRTTLQRIAKRLKAAQLTLS